MVEGGTVAGALDTDSGKGLVVNVGVGAGAARGEFTPKKGRLR